MTQASDHPLPHYRPCVGAFIINAQGKVFVAQRADTEVAAWQLPQGGIDPGESPLDAIWREVHEEIGLTQTSLSLLREHPQWLHYNLPMDLQKKMWAGQYKGQAQKWFYFQFNGDEAEIDLSGPPVEFINWQWANPEDLPTLTIDFKRDVCTEVVRYFQQEL